MPADSAARKDMVPAPLRGVVPLRREEYSDEHGYQAVFVYRGFLLVRIVGVIDNGPGTKRIAKYLFDAVREAPTPLTVFFDLESFARYHSEVRGLYTDAVLEQGGKVERILIYADAKLVRMGATVAGLVLRQLRLVERDHFDRELEKAAGR